LSDFNELYPILAIYILSYRKLQCNPNVVKRRFRVINGN